MRFLLCRTFLGLLLGFPFALPVQAQESKPVLFFAAASLQTALNAVAKEWKKDTGKSVSFSYAASSALAKQLESGAPADLFASADQKWMDWAQEKKLINTASRKTLLGNTLVLIAPADDKTTLNIAPNLPLATALGDGRLATGNPASVPVGAYAKEALTNLGIWAAVEPRLAGTDNVRTAVALVARGEAKFGIVYATDARSEPKVRVVDTFSPTTHAPIVYPFAVTANATNPDAAVFLAYLSSPTAIKIFEAQGFHVHK